MGQIEGDVLPGQVDDASVLSEDTGETVDAASDGSTVLATTSAGAHDQLVHVSGTEDFVSDQLSVERTPGQTFTITLKTGDIDSIGREQFDAVLDQLFDGYKAPPYSKVVVSCTGIQGSNGLAFQEKVKSRLSFNGLSASQLDMVHFENTEGPQITNSDGAPSELTLSWSDVKDAGLLNKRVSGDIAGVPQSKSGGVNLSSREERWS